MGCTLQRYLVTVNPGDKELIANGLDEGLICKVMRELELDKFLDTPVVMLSNEQRRCARIGKALLMQPELLCLDVPFCKLYSFTEIVRRPNDE